MIKNTIFFSLILFLSCSKKTEETNLEIEENPSAIYFPEVDSNTWEVEDINDLNWNEDQLEPLLTFLEENFYGSI